MIAATSVLGVTWYFSEILPAIYLFGPCCFYALAALNNF